MKRKRIALNETQYKLVLEYELLMNEPLLLEAKTFSELLSGAKTMLKRGFTTAAILSMIYSTYDLSHHDENIIKRELQKIEQSMRGETQKNDTIDINAPIDHDKWELVSNKTTATVYNPVVNQCNKDVEHTAHMFRLNLNNVEPQRVVAMERTMMKDCGIKYGDVIYIEGTSDCDGVYRVEDTMNKRFAGQHKVDILKQNRKLGQWNNVNIYTLKDKSDTSKYTSQMAPSFQGNQQIAQNIRENMG